MSSGGWARRRLLGMAAATAVLWPAGLGPTAPAAAAAGPCPGDGGVTVVVDFTDLGGSTAVACAPEEVASGLTALTAAGFSWEPTQRFASFVCRIEGLPAADPCVNTPPASAYWTYWVASRGGPWCYSSVGAASRRPQPGSVEGWVFAKDRPANALPPPRLAAPAPSPGSQPAPLASCPPPSTTTSPRPVPTAAPSPTTPPPTTPSPTTPSPTTGGAAPPPATASPATTTGSTATTVPGPSTTGPGATGRGTETTSSRSPAPTTSAEGSLVAAPRPADDRSSPDQLVLVATLAVGAGVAAAVVSRRRRRSRQGP